MTKFASLGTVAGLLRLAWRIGASGCFACEHRDAMAKIVTDTEAGALSQPIE